MKMCIFTMISKAGHGIGIPKWAYETCSRGEAVGGSCGCDSQRSDP